MKLSTLAIVLALAFSAGAQETNFTGELRVVVWGGLPKKVNEVYNLVLDLQAENGRWGRVYGLAQSYNNGTHEGIVTRGTVTGDEFRLRLEVMIGDDQWTRGGHAGYDLIFRRDAQGRLSGTFDGHFKGIPATGQITGEVKPPRPVIVKDYVPLDPDEHPRVLFRKQDLPALRAKLNTPLGQAYFAKASAKTLNYYAQSTLAPWAWDPINCGVLYQLTGDTNWAARAKAVIERGLENEVEFVSDFGAGSGNCGHRIVTAALTLDLCWDAWPVDFRETLTNRLREEMPNLLKFLYCTSYANTHPCSNYYGPGYGGPAIASLVLWGMKGEEPKRPVDPLTRPRPIVPPTDFTPGEGVPVVDYVSGKTPGQWLLGGPTLFPISGDPLGQLGGSGRARPFAGVTTSQFMIQDGKPKRVRMTFDPMAEKFMTTNGVDLVALAGGTNGPVTVALFAALKVSTEQTVGLVRGQRETMVWLGGVELNEFMYYKLAPGVYPLVVTHTTDAAAGVIAPLFVAADHPLLKTRRDKYEMELALWRLDHEYWEQSGGRDARLNSAMLRGQERMYQHYRLGVGDGGYQAETGPVYAEIASWYPLNYAVAYRKLFGRDASPYPDITHLLPRRLMQVAFRDTPGGKDRNVKESGTLRVGKWSLCQFINSATGIEQAPFAILAGGFPIVPDRYQPAMLWAWNKIREVDPTNPATTANVLADSGFALALSFLHYPLDLKPEPPAKVMPLTWAADTFGYHTFRNGWQDENDFIGQVFLKASLIKAHNHENAGTFALLGLGHAWVNGSSGKRTPQRVFEPCVQLPRDEINESACGRLVYRQTEPNGSGSITIDLNDVYSPSKSRLYDSNLLRLPVERVAGGITGLRALAFDYSGQSGAPCLFVLVDKIHGGKERWWQWMLDSEALGHTRAEGNTFTIDYGDASLKATFITPADAKLDVRSEEVVTVAATATKPASRYPVSYVRVVGQDHFFVVVTIQRKDAPVVKVEGAGLDAKVTVRNQTVRFDGEKIRLGE